MDWPIQNMEPLPLDPAPLDPLPPRANEGLPRRETAPDPQALIDERQRLMDELVAWYQMQCEDHPDWNGPPKLLRQRSGVQMGENPHDWSNMYLSMIRRPRETEEEKRQLMLRIAGDVVTWGINCTDCALMGMPVPVQNTWTNFFHQVRRTLRQKPSKPASR